VGGKVARLTEDAVVMEDGTKLPADLVVYATGYASMNDQCGPSNVASITDEYGRKYNCRGDRIR